MKIDPYHLFRILFCRVFCPCDDYDDCGCRKRLRAKVTFAVGSVSVTAIPERNTVMNFQLPDDKTASASVEYVDAKGKPAKVDGVPVWSSSDTNVFDVTASADGMSGTITPNNPGTAQLTIEADADLGAGVIPLVTLTDIDVIAGQAVAGNVTLTVNP